MPALPIIATGWTDEAPVVNSSTPSLRMPGRTALTVATAPRTCGSKLSSTPSGVTSAAGTGAPPPEGECSRTSMAPKCASNLGERGRQAGAVQDVGDVAAGGDAEAVELGDQLVELVGVAHQQRDL